MYIIINIVTDEIDLATNLRIVSKITQIPVDKMYHTFSRKKEDRFYYLQYKIYKKIPYSNKNEETIKIHEWKEQPQGEEITNSQKQ